MYHKDLEAYKKSIDLVKDIYNVTSSFPQNEQYGLVSQIKRAAISIPSNIAEGNARYSDKDTSHFIDISLGSIAELDTQLLISKELNFVTVDTYKQLCKKVAEVQALLIGLRKYLKGKETKET